MNQASKLADLEQRHDDAAPFLNLKVCEPLHSGHCDSGDGGSGVEPRRVQIDSRRDQRIKSLSQLPSSNSKHQLQLSRPVPDFAGTESDFYTSVVHLLTSWEAPI